MYSVYVDESISRVDPDPKKKPKQNKLGHIRQDSQGHTGLFGTGILPSTAP